MWALGRIQRCCSAAAAAAGATSLSATISPATLASLHAQQSLLAFSTTTTAAHHHHHHLLEPDAAKVQQQLLETALNHVKRLGWTKTALAAAATDMQLSPACVGMFPRGASHLVEHWIAGSNAALEAELQAAQQQYMVLPVRQRITAAVRRRLEMIAPHMDSWPQALALLAQPSNSPAALRLLSQLLDTICYAAGDTSTDGSWYTKRAALAAVYTSTELYMLTDYSPGYADTWQQLERRVDDVMWLGSTAQSLASLPQQLISLLRQQQQQQPSQPSTQPPQQQPEGAAPAAAAAGQRNSGVAYAEQQPPAAAAAAEDAESAVAAPAPTGDSSGSSGAGVGPGAASTGSVGAGLNNSSRSSTPAVS